jgi:hypothetical protein
MIQLFCSCEAIECDYPTTSSIHVSHPLLSSSRLVANPLHRYELLKWEEEQRVQRGHSIHRDLEWATVAREIALMNKPYSRQ